MSQQKALFDAFAKSSATLHLSTENSNRALLALEQMFAKGKIQAQELRLQLGQAIPGAAARFQQAVLEMTKGTDLQGKSFDQLLQNGDLYTAKFLPALVQALQESSRGWEDASESLNAQLNRLSSNWFKLKSEVSGGLFNDAATQGIKFLANNLEHLVDVAGIAGGVLAGRLAGKGLQSGFGAVVGIRAATKATLEEAAATAANTAAQVANSEQRVVAAAIRARELQAKKALAAEQLANAATQREVNIATANYTRIATQAARANAVYRASVVGLTEAQGINAVAQEANAAAVATSGFARAAKGAGGVLLGLVGGVWGAATIALGGLAYAGYKLHEQWEDNRKAATEQVKSIGDVTESLKQLSAAYKDVNARPSAGQLSDALDGATTSIQKARDELAKLQQERSKILASQQRVSAWAGMAGDSADLQKVNADIEALQGKLNGLQLQASKTAGEFNTTLSPAIKQELGKSIDDLIAKVGSAKTAMDLFRAAAGTSLFDVFKNATAASNDASAKYAEFTKNMGDAADAAKRGADEFGKTKSQVLELDLAAYKASPGFKLLAKDQQAAAIASGKAAIESQRHLEALEAAQKGAKSAASAVNKLQDGYESLAKRLRDNIANSDSMLDGSDKLTAAQKLQRDVAYALTHDLKALDGTRKDMLQTLAAKAVAEEADAKAMQDKQALADRALTTQRQLADLAAQQATEIARQNEGIGHGSKWNEQQRQLEAIADEYRRMRTEADKAYQADLRNHVDATVAADAHAAALGKIVLGEQAATAAAMQGFADRDAAQADWVNGARRAMEDYRDRAKDTASQVADLFTNAATNMTDAFVQFAVTGKLSFKDFANSVIADLARIAYRKAIAGIFESVLGSMGSTGASGSYYSQFGGNGAGDGSYGMLLNNYGGGRASGGPTSGGSIYEVAENGRPELYQSGGRTYLLSGSDGHVIPASSGTGARANTAGSP